MKTGIIILRPIGSEMNKVVIDQTFGTAELLLFGSAQMTEPFSAEHRTFFLYYTLHFSKWLPYIFQAGVFCVCLVWFGLVRQTELQLT